MSDNPGGWKCPDCEGEFPDFEVRVGWYGEKLRRCVWCGRKMDGLEQIFDELEAERVEDEERESGILSFL